MALWQPARYSDTEKITVTFGCGAKGTTLVGPRETYESAEQAFARSLCSYCLGDRNPCAGNAYPPLGVPNGVPGHYPSRRDEDGNIVRI